jgi:UDP-glucose 4-epimerase
VEWREWDFALDKADTEIDALFPGAQALLHVGALVSHEGERPKTVDLIKANVCSTWTLGRWALQRGIPLVFLSGAVVYGKTSESNIRETHPTTYQCAGGTYGLTKLLAEEVLVQLAAEGLKLVVLRPSSIYGAGLHPEKMVAYFISRAEKGETIEIAPPGEDKVDLVHAADVAGAMLKALEEEGWGTYNIASEAPVTIAQVAEACISAVGKGKLRILPGDPGRVPQLRFGLCCDLARKKFGFTPRYSDFGVGVREMTRGNIVRGIEMKL